MTLPRLLASLADDAREAGWSVVVTEEGDRVAARFTAPDQTQTIYASYLAGAFVRSYVKFSDQADRQVLLRNLAAARRQIFEPPEKRPVKHQLRRSPKRSARFIVDPNSIGAPMDSTEILPFDLDDADDVILKKLTGKTIFWRNSEMNRIERLFIPETAGYARIVAHPRNHRRMIQAQAQLVYLDRIRRVL